jgi:DHA1 family inner membrane transport protein
MQQQSSPVVHPGLIMLALAMGGFAIGTTEFAAMSLLPYFSAGLGVDAPTAGHVISAYALGVVVGAPIIAVLGAKFARRTLLIALMAMFAVANGLSAMAPDYTSMLFFRFLSGMPHGAYFGVAALVAASLVAPDKRAQAVSRMFMGLTIATVVGVPFANLLGQTIGWRSGFAVVAVLAAITSVLVWRLAPHDRPVPGAGALRELGALGKRQVWLTLGTGAVGFGGLFAVYTYVASTMLEVTRVSSALIPLVLALFGLGMTIGNLVAGWLADRALNRTVIGFLMFNAVVLLLYTVAAGSIWTLAPLVFLIGCSGGWSTILQVRLMDVAGDAQTLAAALHHAAFNLANALGPWLGGMAIASGYGWTSTGWVGALLSVGGLGIFLLSLLDQRASDRRLAAAC